MPSRSHVSSCVRRLPNVIPMIPPPRLSDQKHGKRCVRVRFAETKCQRGLSVPRMEVTCVTRPVWHLSALDAM